MNKALRDITRKIALVSAMSVCAGGGMPYGLNENSHRPTTERERLFVEKQGYKTPTCRNNYEKKLHKKQLKQRKHKGHKYGGGRR